MTWLWALLGLVALQRLGELIYARRNTARLLAQGGRERGARHYPLIVLLHLAWLAAMAVLVPAETQPLWPWLALFFLLQAGRLWVLASLGPYWTTRIITLAKAPLVRHGPYRFLKHPNYLVVALEIAVLPLAFGAWQIALVFSLLNALVLAQRIKVEDSALAERRDQAPRRSTSISSPPF
jgi:methyltransferase